MKTYSLVIPDKKPITVELLVDKALSPKLDKLTITQGSKVIIVKDLITLITLSKSLKSVRQILRNEK